MSIANRRPRFRGLLLGALLVTSFSAVALAEPSVADKETARRLMAEGREKRDAKDLKAALQAFTGADAIMHVPTTGLEVARTQVSLGMLLEAHEVALRVSRSEPEAGEPAPFARARDTARELSDELERRIPTITVKLDGVAPGSAPKVTVDGAVVPNASLALPRTVNPGHHIIIASLNGKQGRAELDLTEGQRKDAVIALTGTLPEIPKNPDDPVEETGKPTGGGGHLGKPLLYGGAIAGGAGLLVGAITGIMSMSKTSGVKDKCQGNTCPPDQQSDIDSAHTLATISNVGFVIAGLGAATAVVGYFVMRGENAAPAEPPAAAAIRVQPWIGAGSAGVFGTF